MTFWTSNIGAKQTELNGVLYRRPEVLNKLQNAWSFISSQSIEAKSI